MVVEVRIPGSALLVPGVAGREDPLVSRREEVLDELRAALGPDPRPTAPRAPRVEVTASTTSRARRGRLRPDLGALGVDARWSGWAFAGNDAADDGPGTDRPGTDGPGADGRAARAGVAATVALLALGAAGWSGPVDVLERAAVPGQDAPDGAVVTVSSDETRRDEPC
jgi:hypothetical protein